MLPVTRNLFFNLTRVSSVSLSRGVVTPTRCEGIFVHSSALLLMEPAHGTVYQGLFWPFQPQSESAKRGWPERVWISGNFRDKPKSPIHQTCAERSAPTPKHTAPIPQFPRTRLNCVFFGGCVFFLLFFLKEMPIFLFFGGGACFPSGF